MKEVKIQFKVKFLLQLGSPLFHHELQASTTTQILIFTKLNKMVVLEVEASRQTPRGPCIQCPSLYQYSKQSRQTISSMELKNSLMTSLTL